MTSEKETISPERLVQLNAMLDKAKLQLIRIKKSVFTTTILFNLKFEFSIKIPTADVDGITLRINPDFWEKIDAPTRVFVLAHEAWHVAFEHITRFGELPDEKPDFDAYNEAADHVINLMLKEKGYKVPNCFYADMKYTNWSTEQVYYHILDNNKKNPSFIPDFTPIGTTSNGTEDETETDSPKPSPEDIKQKIEDMLIKADINSKMNPDDDGFSEDIPDCIKERILDLIDPKIDWFTLLRNYMYENVRDDYSFKRPNRRYMPDVILPSLYSEGMGKLGVAIDVSGSITEEEFQGFITEINQIKDDLNPETIEIIQWHHNIASIDIIESHDTLDGVTFDESGGTDVHPMLRHVIKNPPDILVIFTDGYFTPFNKPDLIDFPVIWVIDDNEDFKCSFGQIINYQRDTE